VLRLLSWIIFGVLSLQAESFLLEGKLERATECVRLEWENQDGLRSTIPVAAEWRVLVPLALGENQMTVTATYRNGETKQIAYSLWGRQAGRPREIAGQVLFGGRMTAYTIEDGQVVVEDHILLGPVAEVLGGAPSKGRNEALVIRNQASRWTNNTVPYAFDAALPEASREEFLRAVEFWRANTPLRFVVRTTEANFLRVVRLLPDEGACFSNIGMQTGETLMRLADSCSQSTVTHEVGHAIGLYHEHVRGDREAYVSIDPSRARLEGQGNFFPQLGNSVESGPYDFASLMHYAQFEFGRANLPVIFTIPRGMALREADPTVGDLEAVRRLYGDNSTDTWITTNPEGIEIEVDGLKAVSPQRYRWEAGSTHRISVPALSGSGDNRNRFGRWSNDGPIEQSIRAGATRIFAAHYVRECRVPVGMGNPVAGGTFTITPHYEDGYYPCDSELSFEAQPADGFSFLRWNYLGMASRNPVTLRIGAAFSSGGVRPSFTQRRLITVTSEPPGRQVTVDGQRWTTPVRFDWADGTRHTIAAADQDVQRIQYRFSNWSQGGAATQEVLAGAAAATFTARFETRFRLARLTVGNGTLTASPASSDNTYPVGTVVSLTATPASGGTFRNFYGSIATTQNPATLTMDDEKAVTANFSLAAPTITASAPDSILLGSPGTLLRLAGTNFIDGISVVRVNGAIRRPVFQGTTQLELALEAADLASTPLAISVSNAALPAATLSLVLRPRDASCVWSVERNVVSIGAAGGAVAIPVSSGENCPWRLNSAESWLQVPPRLVRGGADFASFFVSPNPGLAARSGVLRLGDQSITVNQEGRPCAPVFSPPEAVLPSGGGSLTVDVGLYRSECLWNLAGDADWVSLQGLSAAGMGQLTLRAEANGGVASRSAVVRLAGAALPVRQASSVVPRITGIVSEADGQAGTLGRGSRIWIQVTGLAGPDAGGLRVLFGETPATIVEATPERIVALLPEDAPLGDVAVRVFNGGQFAEPFAVAVAEVAPRLYIPIAPADEEGLLTVTVTGFGPAEPLLPVAARVLDVPAEVVSSELLEPGKLRLRLRLPAVEGAERTLVVKVGDVESPPALLP
jgi:uncharacterized protein (TIGR03437 family)